MLEAHTGRILTKENLSLKYKSNPKLDKTKYPLDTYLLQIFGDGYDIQHMDAKAIVAFEEMWDKNRMTKKSPFGKIKFLVKKFLSQYK
jgi:hypothetical protein